MRYRVAEEEKGLSLLSFLHQKGKGEHSIKRLKGAIASKACLVGGKVQTFSSYKLSVGEIVEFDETVMVREIVPLEILYEDEYLLAVNKQSGQVCKDPFCKDPSWKLIHRLDKETTGVLLLAKPGRIKDKMEELFALRQIDKLYLAICDGRISSSKGVITTKLSVKKRYQGQTIYGSSAKGEPAVTHWKKLASGEDSSLVLCDLKTGRTHQIRVHMSEMGHPILGDVQYAKQSFLCPYISRRHLLHAWKISFVHPAKKKKISITAQVPLDMQEAVKRLYPGCNLGALDASF